MAVSSDFEKIDLNALFGGESCLLIRIRGESMLESIHDGDWVILDRSKRPYQGQIVVARLGDGYTIKRFEQDRRGLRLAPVNKEYPATYVSESDEFGVVGVVVHVIHPLL